MSKIHAAIVVLIVFGLHFAGNSQADAKGSRSVHVRSYTRKDGTFVRSHSRSAPGGGFSNSSSSTYHGYTGPAGSGSAPYGSPYQNSVSGFGSYPTGPVDPLATYGGAFGSPSTYNPNALNNRFEPMNGANNPPPSFNTADEWVAYAEQMTRAGEFEQAVQAYGKAIAIAPSAELNERLAIAYCQLARSKDTQSSFQFFHRSLAIAQIPSTEQYLADALRKSKRDPLSFKQRMIAADIARRLGDHIGEIIEYQAAAKLEPNSKDVHLALARAYARSGLHKAALSEFQHATACGINPELIAKELQHCEQLRDTESLLPAHYFSNLRN